MWDIGGQEALRQSWSTYYSGTHFLILVMDSTDRERVSITKEELYRMLNHEVCGGYRGMVCEDVEMCVEGRCGRIWRWV